MCGRCEGEPYRGVGTLFSGDNQRRTEHGEREEWRVVSERIIIFLGETAMSPEFVPLFRGCEAAIATLNDEELEKITALGAQVPSRPAIGSA